MNIWLVSPAYRRFIVTRLVLAQRRWLCDELGRRGHHANSVIVADDDNLAIAEEYGFATVEYPNDDLGAKFNMGYQYAADQGADLFVHVGSDDWVHPDTFNAIDSIGLEYGEEMDPDETGSIVWSPGPIMIAQRSILMVDLNKGTGRRCHVRNRWGCIPWLIPRDALAPSGFAPIERGLVRGIDGALARGLGHGINLVWQHAQPEWCVDWKTDENLTAYAGVTHTLGVGEEQEPWPMLQGFYPASLIEQAMTLSAA